MTVDEGVADPTDGATDCAGESVVVRRPGEGTATWAMGSLFEHLVTASDTHGLLGVSLVTQPPGDRDPTAQAHQGSRGLSGPGGAGELPRRG
jgi:hypothetical protein